MTSYTHKEKGNSVVKSTGDYLLDLFSSISELDCKPSETELRRIKELIKHCLHVSVKDTMVVLFYLRDRENGLGYRDAFVELFAYTLNLLTSYGHSTNDETIETILSELVINIEKYGRYDDIIKICKDLMSWKLRTKIIKFIYTKMFDDLDKSCDDEPVSLLGKWLPSINTSSKKTRDLAKFLIKEFSAYRKRPMSKSLYRCICSKLRKSIEIVEHNVTSRTYNQIDYSNVPSLAMLRYNHIFLERDKLRFIDYIRHNKNKFTKSYARLNIVDIVSRMYCLDTDLDEEEINALNTQWNNIKKLPCNCIVCMDGSESMYSRLHYKFSPVPINVAKALTIYCSENSEVDAYKNKFITFGTRSVFVDMSRCRTLKDKVDVLTNFRDCGRTNFVSMFKTILNHAKVFNITPEQMVKSIVVVSDMEFDDSFTRNTVTHFKHVQQMYEHEGYTVPRVIFWNVRAWEEPPMELNDVNTTVLSGWSHDNIHYLVNNVLYSPRTILNSVLSNDRYREISDLSNDLVFSDFDYL